FSGDFSYNIPLLDVGGYPVNIAYHSGISMEEDASWVGLGWNINPGSITRNMRGLPDDFNGQTDTIKKVANIKPNLTWGVNVGDNFEVFGLPSVTLGAGIFHSTYNGWGTELTMNASIDAGIKSFGTLTGGLAIKDNSQSGLTLNPSLSARFATHNASNTGGALFGVNLSAPYNSRTGLKEIGLGLSAKAMGKNKNNPVNLLNSSGGISFNWPAYNPTITLPMTNYNFSFTAKVGGAATGWHPNLFLSGYVSKEYVAASDTSISLPAFGYLNFQNKAGNLASVTDFNREKDMPYRESPPIPHIAIPSYTYDVFSISGEGTGGSFRAYRGDIGFVADPLVSSKAISGAASIDLGGGNILHGGVDLNANYSVTRSGPWLSENPLSNTIKFRNSNGLFEAAYFRNPGEKTINTTAFYNAIGGDNVAVASLYQAGNSSPSTIATNNLTLFNGKKLVGTVPLDSSKVIRQTRDKRSEVISYLTASEASIAGLDKSIYSYAVNHFSPRNCNNDITDESEGKGTGFLGYYYWNMNLQGKPAHIRQDTVLYFNWGKGNPFHHSDDGVTVLTDNTPPLPPGDRYSVRWLGRLKAPATGPYTFGIFCDDGVRFWLNDSLLIPDWEIQGHTWDTVQVNLVGGHMYNLRLEYFENRNDAFCQLAWRRPDRPDVPFDIHHRDTIPKEFCY
ncbi:MAG: PA14 domain-containing protein, partial [Chitinophaga rupis]